MLRSLKHQNILPFIDLLPYEEEYLYLMTEYAAHGSLRDRLSLFSELPLQEVNTILTQIGHALEYIHHRNIVHCDLKPENILFNAQDEALLADFGIAKIAAAIGMERNEMVGHGTGTPAYMAPEQIQGNPTPHSDQYAFVSMAYELVAGRTPFKGSQNEILLQQRIGQPIDPRTFKSDIPKYMAEAIMKGLAKEPSDRHANMTSCLAAMRMSIGQETIVILPQASIEVEKLVDKGYTLLGNGQFKEALELFQQALDYNPKSAKAYCGKGDASLMLGGRKLDTSAEALAAYNAAIKLDPKFITAYVGRGDTYTIFGKYQQALEDYQQAVRLAPEASFCFKMADTFIKLKADNEALEAYDKAISCGADPVETRQKKIALLESLHRYSEALTEYNQIIQCSSDPLAACYEKREFLLHKTKRYNEALAINETLATYNQIIALKPGDIKVYDEEVDFLEKLVDHDDNKRLAIYNHIINLVPDEIKVHIYCKQATLLEQYNRFNEVPAIYDRIIEFAPDDITARRNKLAAFERLEWPVLSELRKQKRLSGCV